MSTEQSYVGRGTNAIPPTQMGQNTAKTPQLPDGRLNSNISDAAGFPQVSLALYLHPNMGGFSDLEVVYIALASYKKDKIKELLESYEHNDDESAAIELDEIESIDAIQTELLFKLVETARRIYVDWHKSIYPDGTDAETYMKQRYEEKVRKFTETYRTKKP